MMQGNRDTSGSGMRDSSAARTNRDDLVRRSTLIVPTHVARFVERAKSARADAIMLDLEDGVAPSQKDTARSALARSVAFLKPEVRTVLIRVNNDTFSQLVADLLVALDARPDGIFVPKIESAEEVIRCDAIIAAKEVELGLAIGSIELALTLETPRGILAFQSICDAAPARVATIAFGSEDIALELGIQATEAGLERLVGNSLVVLAAAAHHLQPLGLLGDLANYKDPDVLEAAALRSFVFGFMGSYCIHPSQVPIFNRAFTPSADEVAFANSVHAAQQASQGQAQQIEKKMVAASAFRRSQRLLQRMQHIASYEAHGAQFTHGTPG